VTHDCCRGFSADDGIDTATALAAAWARGASHDTLMVTAGEEYRGSLVARDLATLSHLGPLATVIIHGERQEALICRDLVAGVGLPATRGDGSAVVTQLRPAVARPLELRFCNERSCEILGA
jgi:hypothetical protein